MARTKSAHDAAWRRREEAAAQAAWELSDGILVEAYKAGTPAQPSLDEAALYEMACEESARNPRLGALDRIAFALKFTAAYIGHYDGERWHDTSDASATAFTRQMLRDAGLIK